MTLLFIGPLTYDLGVAAGFFVLAKISPIVRGYQIENNLNKTTLLYLG